MGCQLTQKVQVYSMLLVQVHLLLDVESLSTHAHGWNCTLQLHPLRLCIKLSKF